MTRFRGMNDSPYGIIPAGGTGRGRLAGNCFGKWDFQFGGEPVLSVNSRSDRNKMSSNTL